MAYTIIEVERQTGIASRTLRFWASKGLFPFTQLNEHGVRYFAQSDVEWAQWVECLRSLDMSISDIRRYIYLFSQGFKTASERKALLVRQRTKITAHIKALEKALDKIDFKIGLYEDMEALGVDLFDKTSEHYYKKLKRYKNHA